MSVCVKNKHTNKVEKVSKDEARKLVAGGAYAYVPKSDWQRQEGLGRYEISDTEEK
ncbi:MAG: hypothetical protein WC455_13280 [Dehalococcoidia bacterium]|jgi:hypothetical protein